MAETSSTTSLTILFAGGGSGGHLYPGIAVAEALRDVLPHAKPLFLCTERAIDSTILEPTGFEFIRQPVVPIKRSIGGLLSFWRAWRATHDLVGQVIADCKPVAVLGLGGYAAGVAVRLAPKHKLPAAILNPDVIPGRANQHLLKYVTAVCCGFDSTKANIAPAHQSKLRLTGCPIRNDIVAPRDRAAAAERLSLDPNLKTLVVTGASQGAATVNDAVIESLRAIKLQGWQVLHLSGKDHADKVRKGYREANLGNYVNVIDFTPAMADVWAVADLAVSRSGASSVAELAACGVPSILMPYPFHKDMHQLANARELERPGGALIVDDTKDARRTAEKLRPAIEALLYDADRRQAMAARAKSAGRPDAARAVAEVLRDLARR
jgi:UDP-N-acetylglucosamine--N-acetylmuramyl-(pentapeptide) pyrophosphoryl-undecaprenol N-acetylglucosamine transferase